MLNAALHGSSVEKLFSKFDKDHDGLLSAEEFRKLLRLNLRVPPSVLSDKDIESFVLALDDDDSGTLAIDEIVDFAKRGAATFFSGPEDSEEGEASASLPSPARGQRASQPQLKDLAFSTSASVGFTPDPSGDSTQTDARLNSAQTFRRRVTGATPPQSGRSSPSRRRPLGATPQSGRSSPHRRPASQQSCGTPTSSRRRPRSSFLAEQIDWPVPVLPPHLAAIADQYWPPREVAQDLPWQPVQRPSTAPKVGRGRLSPGLLPPRPASSCARASSTQSGRVSRRPPPAWAHVAAKPSSMMRSWTSSQRASSKGP